MLLLLLLFLSDPPTKQPLLPPTETLKMADGTTRAFETSIARELVKEQKKYPLHFAARFGDLATLKAASDKQLKRDDWHHRTPIMVAAEANHEALLYLVERGFDLNIKDKKSDTLLHYAARGGQQKNIEWLITQGLEVDTPGLRQITPLMVAVLANQPAAVSTLLNLGADPEKKDQSGDSPIVYVRFLRNRQMHKMICETGWQGAALHCSARAGDNEGILNQLAKGQSVDVVNPVGETALLAALSEGQLETARVLLEKKANPNFLTNYAWSPLYLAVYKNRLDLVELLLQNGANPNLLLPGGDGPLGCALSLGHQDIALTLLAAGANLLYGNPATQKLETITPTPLPDLQARYHSALQAGTFSKPPLPFWLEGERKAPLDPTDPKWANVIPPKFTRQVAPVFPANFSSSPFDKTVTLKAVLGSDGNIRDIEIVGSVNRRHAGIDIEAIKAFRQWTFKPAMLEGQPIDTPMTLTVSFAIR